jgi:hypothetical protein
VWKCNPGPVGRLTPHRGRLQLHGRRRQDHRLPDHQPLELARAYSARNLRDKGLAVLLDAEQIAPEQVRHHFISRQLVLAWIRQLRRKPDLELAGLAARLHLT